MPKIKVQHFGGKSVNLPNSIEIEANKNWHYMWSKFYYYKKNFSIINAYKKGISINEKSVLKRYEIRRKSMNLLMLKSMDFFVDLFGSENLYVRLFRNFGLSFVNKSRFIKTFFIRQASGINKI